MSVKVKARARRGKLAETKKHKKQGPDPGDCERRRRQCRYQKHYAAETPPKTQKNKDLASKDSVLSKLDEILVGIGKYPGKKELMEDAFRALLRAKPELKMDLAVELYKKRKFLFRKVPRFPD